MNNKKQVVLNLVIITVVLFFAIGIKTGNTVHNNDINRFSFVVDKYESVGFESGIELIEKIIHQYIVRWIEC
ncbi:hypothetical protein [Elizabethkingia ursingii]|uniref:hypothetical protein n=1 Tax=Elizabethkingia ursingii TaxID=1756150 RepID=UPI0007518CC0|nr:hypothetical protein [Elizabethkingia ursingii]KUY30489.1 hypothetical protein ATB96_14750 [Elizabethkingia ursingii]